MVSKVFVHLTNLKLPQISPTYLKFFVSLEHLIRIHLEYYENMFTYPQLKLCLSFMDRI